jgi:hypothetical protein
MRNFKELMEGTGKVEVSLKNEGHSFYTEYIKVTEKGPNKILNIEKRMSNITKMLKKELPGGSWSYSIDD